jgi:CubicO group peptidase (beta-lactamase class C family)
MRVAAKSIVMGFGIGMACVVWPATSAIAEAPVDAATTAVLRSLDGDEHADLRGVVVLRDGQRIAERYYNGAGASELHDVRSAGKSITALLVGIAIDQGKIRSIDDAVERYWPEAEGTPIGAVSLRDVLGMRSGLAAFDEDDASPGSEDRMDEASDPRAFVLGLPRADPPGTRYRYNSVTAWVAGMVVERASGETLEQFARTTLFEPLGITSWRWAADKAGVTKGQGNLALTTRDLATIGAMVLANGEHAGRRIVSASWLRDALAPTVPISADDHDPYADAYGYFWYVKQHAVGAESITVAFASGNGGNKIYVVPHRRLVIAITSAAYGRGYGQRRSARILAAVLASTAGAGK